MFWRQRWRACLRVSRRILDWIPVTVLGAGVISLGALGLQRLALVEMDLVWLIVGIGVVGFTALGVLLVVTTAIALKLRIPPGRPAEVQVVETGAWVATGFFLRAVNYIPLLRVRAEWDQPGGVQVQLRSAGAARVEYVRFRRRGPLRTQRRRIIVEDTLALTRLAIRHQDRRAFDVLPHAGKLRSFPVLNTLAGGEEQPHPFGIEDGDRVELRRYVPGDPARLIHWKVFARTRELVVRLPERSLSIARRIVAYLAVGEHDEPSAAVVRVALEMRVFGDDWVFGVDGIPGSTPDPREALQRIVKSGNLEYAAPSDNAEGLVAFLEEVEREGPAAVIVFAPAAAGPWIERVLQVAKSRPHRVRVVIGVDGPGSGESLRQPWRQRWLYRPPVRVELTSPDVTPIVNRLARHRIPVLVLDRVSGRILHGAGTPSRAGVGFAA